MKLTLKLPLAIAAMLLLVAAAAMYGIFTLNRAIDTYAGDVMRSQQHAAATAELLVDFKTQVQEWKNTLLRGKDAKALDRHWGAFVKIERDMAQHVQALVADLPAGEARTLVERFGQAHKVMGQAYAKGFEAYKAADFDASAGDKAVAGIDREPARLLDQASEKMQALAREQAAAAAAQARRATVASLVLMVLACLGGAAAAVVFSRSITRPLGRAVDASRAVADGDLTFDVQARGRDEIGLLLSALQQMRTRLATVVGEVRGNAESVSTASAQIAQGNADLSQRTEQQAASLQETAATMEELGSTARSNSESARQANQLAQAACGVAVRGGEVVTNVVSTMHGISESSAQIAHIVGTIDGIAFQTNILALNAAVEAARAGEQGRGFAVVASEVRALAQRSAAAAREIKALIGTSVERVEQGTSLVGEAGRTMDEVVASIRRVTDIVGEISSASAAQGSGVQQVGDAVNQMDQVTQQNAALVEQSAAAAESLKHQAAALVRTVSVFKLQGTPTA